jgi:uncharacterized iron-regulated membrane protein
MTKFFNKWLRIFHRWISVPTIILIPIAVFAKFSGSGKFLPPQIDQVQSILILMLALTGAYLFLIPYIVKWQRNRRRKNKQKKASAQE